MKKKKGIAETGTSWITRRLRLETMLEGHDGCVNTITWNRSGALLLSGSDDQFLGIWDAEQRQLKSLVPTSHQANIFSAMFLPASGDRRVVSCDAEGLVCLVDVENPDASSTFQCQTHMAHQVLVDEDNPSVFLTAGEDGQVRQYDLRIKTSCECTGCSQDVVLRNFSVFSRRLRMGVGCLLLSCRVFL